MVELNLEGFLARVRARASVSHYEFTLGFKWDTNAVKALLAVVGELREKGLTTDLSWANLSSANLSSANLSSANLSRANLSDANLSEADLSDANLSGADLSRANLSDANLSEADLSDANLSSANLSLANLSGADLSRANLSGANLSWADLSWADLSGADLLNIHGSVGFAFSLRCGESLNSMLKDAKLDAKTRDYLTIQSLARLSWEAKEGVMPYMRKWFECEQTTPPKMRIEE